jgi:hypothetical protein
MYGVESGMNPGINEKNPLIPGSRGGYGIAQLTGSRRRDYERFAAVRGKPFNDLDTQLAFMVQEREFQQTMKAMKGVESPRDAAGVWGRVYEKPADFSSVYHKAARASEEIYRNSQAKAMDSTQSPLFVSKAHEVNMDVGGIHIDARDTGGDPDLIASRLAAKMEEFKNRAVSLSLRDQQGVY